jgi:hypothetical protein
VVSSARVYFAVSFPSSPSWVDVNLNRLLPCFLPPIFGVVRQVFRDVADEGGPVAAAERGRQPGMVESAG